MASGYRLLMLRKTVRTKSSPPPLPTPEARWRRFDEAEFTLDTLWRRASGRPQEVRGGRRRGWGGLRFAWFFDS